MIITGQRAFAVASFAITLFFISLTTSVAIAQVDIKPEAKIGAKALEALKLQSEVRVVVALSETDAERTRPVQLANLRNDIAKRQSDVESRLDKTDFKVLHKFQGVPALVGLVTVEGIQKLAGDMNVAKIDLDEGGRGGLVDTVPLINADKWNAMGITGNNVVVAVLDSGADSDHSDLSDNLIHQQCFLDNDGAINGAGSCPNGSDRQSGAGAAEDNYGHGTFVTGIITARGIVSSVGVAPNAKFVAVKVLDNANRFFYFSEIVAALDYILNSRPDVRVINMSLGTDALFSGNCDSATAYTMAGASVINSLRNRANNPVVTFASSMNNGSGSQMGAPACLRNVISVGATTKGDTVASFTNSNSTLDLMAPGVNVTSDWLHNGSNTGSGTSYASPHAAACAALLLQSDSTLTPSQIETRLKVSPVSVTDPKNGLSFPRLNCSPPESPAALKTLTLNPASVAGGNTSTATVTLTGAAPSGGTVVQLLSSNTSAATTPASVTITAGLTSKTFTVTTKSVTNSTMVDISANAGGLTKKARLTVTLPRLTGLVLNPTSMTSPCQTSTGTVTLSGRAPVGGVQIAITKSNSTVTVPSSVIVPAGATSKTFTITASNVMAKTASTITAKPVDAKFGGISYSRPLTVLPNGVVTLSMPTSVTGPVTITATVTLTCRAPSGGQVVNLSTNNPAVARPTLNGSPISSLTIAQGKTTATFKVTVADVSSVKYAAITAKANGVYKSVRLTVNP